jgi:5,10-methylenetetrahydromethanopterin reductase
VGLQLLLLGDAPVADLVKRAQLAEASQYGNVWIADERFYREVYSSLAVVATQTNRIRLGPCVTDPFARHPALTAMAIATLDEISGGRAVLGMGAGISGFAELGIERKKPPRAMREAIHVIRALLRGEEVQFEGEVISFRNGHLSFKPLRPGIPVYVASNGPLGQRLAGSIADAVIMEACGSVEEAFALKTEVARGAQNAGRDPGATELIARLNACVSGSGRVARDTVRPSVARLLGRRSLKLATADAQGLALPDEAVASIGDAPYAEGVKPYLPLLPLVTDRHVDAFTLAGTAEEIVSHALALRRAGIGSILIRPLAPPGGSVEEVIETFGTKIWPAVEAMTS